MFALACFSLPGYGSRLFLFPGELAAPNLSPLLPTALADAIAGDEGGPSAVIGLLLFWSAVFWFLLFSAASYLAIARRRKT